MKTSKYKNLTIGIVLAMIPMLWACTTDDEPEITVPEGNEDYFLNPMEFDSMGGDNTFTFSTNGNWTIDMAATQGDDNWVAVSPMSGKKGVNTITVTVKANIEFRERSMTIPLTVGTLVKEITINQAQAPVPSDDYLPSAVDLGLESGTLWASCNIGATKPEEYGDYYAWGETGWNPYYNCESYKYYQNNWVDIGSDIAGSSDYDVARVKLGESWQMPTQKQMQELVDSCTWTWTKRNDVSGMTVTGPNGNSIFLPAAGFQWNRSFYKGGSYGGYWTSTLSPSYNGNAYSLYFFSDEWSCSYDTRDTGLSIRAVREKRQRSVRY